jgi:hypothetical protein
MKSNAETQHDEAATPERGLSQAAAVPTTKRDQDGRTASRVRRRCGLGQPALHFGGGSAAPCLGVHWRIPLRFLALIGAACVSGCSSCQVGPPLTVLPDAGRDGAVMARAQQTIAGLFPPRYRATQRAIITVGRQQFTGDGVLTVAPGEGCQLAVVSSLGAVTGLRVKPDGACELLKVTPLFREDWSRRFVAEDLRRLFLPPSLLEPAGRLADGRLVLQTAADAEGLQARYVFTADGGRWQELELVRDGRSVYHASVRRYRAFAGVPGDVPGEFEVNAGSHRLELRITELSVPAASGTEGPP